MTFNYSLLPAEIKEIATLPFFTPTVTCRKMVFCRLPTAVIQSRAVLFLGWSQNGISLYFVFEKILWKNLNLGYSKWNAKKKMMEEKLWWQLFKATYWVCELEIETNMGFQAKHLYKDAQRLPDANRRLSQMNVINQCPGTWLTFLQIRTSILLLECKYD